MSRLGWFGVVVTVAYFGLFWWLFGAQVSQIKLLKPNELGDFFAGVFGPLALFWVVLGFFQQGIELRHSVDTLKLQAEELRNSVEQQRELVSVSREQIALDRENILAQRAHHEASIRPDFVISASGSSESGSEKTFSLEILNRGEIATDVRIKFEPPVVTPSSMVRFQSVNRGEHKRFNTKFFERVDRGGSFKLFIDGVNKEGGEFSDFFNFFVKKNSTNERFTELEISKGGVK